MSLHTKTQLLEALYRKSLRVSSAVKAALGVGPIVNLQSNDAAKLWTMPTYLHMVWNGPFQVGRCWWCVGTGVRVSRCWMAWSVTLAGLHGRGFFRWLLAAYAFNPVVGTAQKVQAMDTPDQYRRC